MMDLEKAKKFIIECLNRDIKLHEEGKLEQIGNGYDEYDNEFPRTNRQLMIAWDFWDAWIDERNHGFPCFYKGITKQTWPDLAKHIVEKLSEGEEISDQLILSNFVFERQPSLFDKIKKLMLVSGVTWVITELHGEITMNRISAVIFGAWILLPISVLCKDEIEVPKIDYLVPLDPQPYSNVIWYDNFDSYDKQNQYAEKSGKLSSKERFGDKGMSLEMFYPKGGKGIGNRKLFFGDSPTYISKTIHRGKKFTDVYWRIYVKHQKGWTGGGPAKLSRATVLTSSNWQQAMILHVWSSKESLTLDPASGVRGDKVITRKYNDFGKLKWLGNSPPSKFLIHSTKESGRWICVEARAKLNTPGKKDGYAALWIDGLFQTERKNLDFIGSYYKKGINAVFLEAYWNRGSPVDQSRYIDEFVVSTRPIGPVYCPVNPTLVKIPYYGPKEQAGWEVEIAMRLKAKPEGDKSDIVRIYESEDLSKTSNYKYNNPVIGEDVWGEVVWSSKFIKGEELKVKVSSLTGNFKGVLRGGKSLLPGRIYFCRCRQKSTNGEWSKWSKWHQPFQTPKKEKSK